ncbi:hypothetical protein [Kitasatospora brasiliensis]|uniref:hypothetical protein n=1 Tax=Kitasatospora brasiliensis TaxID=3058040 RepID=UPI00292CF913|nr:hypothetical protein [Kitasatospora sp. K002]
MTRTLVAVVLGAAAWVGGVAPAGAAVFGGGEPQPDFGTGGNGGHSCVSTTAWGDNYCPGKPLS